MEREVTVSSLDRPASPLQAGAEMDRPLQQRPFAAWDLSSSSGNVQADLPTFGRPGAKWRTSKCGELETSQQGTHLDRPHLLGVGDPIMTRIFVFTSFKLQGASHLSSGCVS